MKRPVKISNILFYFVVLVLFTFFAYAEFRYGIKGMALALYFSLIYNKKNIIVLSPLYIGSAVLVSPTIPTLICSATPVAVALITVFIHYKLGKRIKLKHVFSYVFISNIPLAVFAGGSVSEIASVIISFIVAEVMTYSFIVTLNAVFKKKLRFKLTGEEKIAFCIIVAGFFASTTCVNLYFYSPYYTILVFCLLSTLFIEPKLAIVIALSAAFGGGLILKDASLFVISTAIGVAVSVFKRQTQFLAVAIVPAVFVILDYIFNKSINYFSYIAPAIALLAFCVIPNKVKNKLCVFTVCVKESDAERGLVNRDRHIVSAKLKYVADTFLNLSDVLQKEISKKSSEETMHNIINTTLAKCCDGCIYKNSCKENLGEGRLGVLLEDLVCSAIDNGKATILDTSPFLSAHCKRINGLISTTNEVVERYALKEEKQAGIITGKNMIATQMAGVGVLLNELSDGMQKRMNYDEEKEKKLLEELTFAGIGGSGLAIGKTGVGSYEVSMFIKERDFNNSGLIQTVNRVLGTDMEIISKEKAINDNIAITLAEAPKYLVTYSKKCLPSGVGKTDEEDANGDKASAVRIGDDRVMLVLSDGMGNGKVAEENSGYCVNMLEGFYRAGFDHTTIINTVGKLLSLRGNEEFNALDIGVIDTQNGISDFIKVGGRESYIVNEDGVFTIECGSLPLGIVEEPQPIIEQFGLKKDNMIVMISDGIADVLESDKMTALLKTNMAKNPDTLAEIIIENFLHLVGESPHDDATVLVTRITKRQLLP